MANWSELTGDRVDGDNLRVARLFSLSGAGNELRTLEGVTPGTRIPLIQVTL